MVSNWDTSGAGDRFCHADPVSIEENTSTYPLAETADNSEIMDAEVQHAGANGLVQSAQGYPAMVAMAVEGSTHGLPATSTFSTFFRSRKFSVVVLSLVSMATISVFLACLIIVLEDDGSSRPSTPVENEASANVPQLDYERRLAEAMDVLIESGVSKPSSFVEATDPRYRALDWSVYKDLTWTSLVEQESRNRFLQRYALILLAYSTGIEYWKRQTPWSELVKSHECTSFEGVQCDDNDFVVELSMSSWGLSGTIPEELGLVLTSLTHLDLKENFLEGSIPESLYELNLGKYLMSLSTYSQWLLRCDPNRVVQKHAEYLDLHMNEFSSTISSKIGQLTDLKHFAVGDNRLTGTLPIEALQQLTKLQRFVLTGNRVEGRPFDAVISWSQLVELGLYSLPFIEGSIPTSIGKLSMLQYLMVENMDNVIPTEVGMLTNLLSFHFSIPGPAIIEGLDSSMTATLPTELGLLTNLATIMINSNNEIGGTIPSGKSEGLTGISEGTYTSYSSLIFLCGPELGRLTNLEHLNFVLNAFTGQLPSTLGNLSNLRFAAITNSAWLTGTVPQEFGLIAGSLGKSIPTYRLILTLLAFLHSLNPLHLLVE